jgi:outer membrane lipoprotein SlyB
MDIPFEISYRTKFQRRFDWPVDLGIAAGCILGYLIAWIGLIICFGPSHWIGGILGALAGGVAGWVWFKVKIRNN